jgi:hypothetical protein
MRYRRWCIEASSGSASVTNEEADYTITSEKDHTVDLMVEGSSFPNWNGGIQKRIITVAGDELRVVNPTPAIGSGTNHLIFKKSK